MSLKVSSKARGSVLIASPQDTFGRRLCLALERAGLRCRMLPPSYGVEAFAQLAGPGSLLVLDVPEMDADLPTLARRARAVFDGPIIVLCHPLRASEPERAACMEAGVDDCVSRATSTRLLVATIMARLRPTADPEDPGSKSGRNLVRVGSLVIDRASRRVTLGGRQAHLTPKELDVLITLASEPGRPIPPERLLRLLWGFAPGCRSRTVHVHIRRLRLKLERDPHRPQLILTRRGFGYELRRP